MEKASVIFLAFLQRNGMVVVVILAVLAVRALLRKCPKKYSYALWAIVGIRMLFDLPRYFVDRTFDGSLPGFITAFLGGKKISKKEAKLLKKMIDEHKEG